MNLMKKAIRAAIFVLAVCLMAVSCTKTASNTFALLGNWELVRTDVTYGGHTETLTLERAVFVEFHSGDEYVWTEESFSGSTTQRGRWYVEDDMVTLTQTNGGYRVFRIEETGLTRLVLSETVTEDGVTKVYRDTYRSFVK